MTTTKNAKRPTSTEKQDPILIDLAEQIRAHVALYENDLRTTLKHARQAGEALVKAKARVKENGGAWLRWLDKNCKLSPRQAQKYMRLAADHAKLTEQGHDSASLTINQALELIAQLRDPSPKQRGSTLQPADEAQQTARYYRLSSTELKVKTQEARRLKADAKIRFEDDTPEGKLLKEVRQGLILKLRKEVEKLLARKERTGEVQEAHLLIALTEQLSLDLSTETVFEIGVADVQPTPKSDSSPTTEETPHPVGQDQKPAAEQNCPEKPQEVQPTNRLKNLHQGNGTNVQVA